MAACYVVPRTPSSLALFSNHGRNGPRLSGTKGGVCFFAGLFTAGVFLGVRVLAFDVQHTNVRLTELSGPRTKACREEGRREEYKGEEKCFLSFSITSKLFTWIVLARRLSFSSAWVGAIISWRDDKLFNLQWAQIWCGHMKQIWCGPFLNLAQTS